jgi:crossover junction endodeoxyribonuclease RusA
MLYFYVPGVPAPKGSYRRFKNSITAANPEKTYSWQAKVSQYAQGAMKLHAVISQPCKVSCLFVFKKPQRPKHQIYHIVKPDGDKLLRCVLDALTGIVYRDDSMVSVAYWSKEYETSENKPGLYIKIERLS